MQGEKSFVFVFRDGQCAVREVPSSFKTSSYATRLAVQTFTRCRPVRCLTWESLSGVKIPRSAPYLCFHLMNPYLHGHTGFSLFVLKSVQY